MGPYAAARALAKVARSARALPAVMRQHKAINVFQQGVRFDDISRGVRASVHILSVYDRDESVPVGFAAHAHVEDYQVRPGPHEFAAVVAAVPPVLASIASL